RVRGAVGRAHRSGDPHLVTGARAARSAKLRIRERGWALPAGGGRRLCGRNHLERLGRIARGGARRSGRQAIRTRLIANLALVAPIPPLRKQDPAAPPLGPIPGPGGRGSPPPAAPSSPARAGGSWSARNR